MADRPPAGLQAGLAGDIKSTSVTSPHELNRSLPVVVIGIQGFMSMKGSSVPSFLPYFVTAPAIIGGPLGLATMTDGGRFRNDPPSHFGLIITSRFT